MISSPPNDFYILLLTFHHAGRDAVKAGYDYFFSTLKLNVS